MIIEINNRALLRIRGKDAKAFLQAQFTNNIFQITPNGIQVNAYCQHQGKIMALLWVFVRNDNLYLSFPEDLKELVVSKLNMFKLMSNVEIDDFSHEIKQYGLIDEKFDGSFTIKNNLSVFTTREILDNDGSMQHWEKACINNNIPEIYQETSEQFIPQAINLDIDEFGVSFTKGCYPGQEVVARMHYLGKPKRRLFRFISEFEVNVGDLINVEDSSSLKASGVVLRIAKIDETYHMLGTFETKHASEIIYLNNDINKSITIIDVK